ncbi:MAG: hydantoinase B/oxoprolinase family protein, partial [Proteobacteria bacterium]|nr:hydantoinase B/oxoprolinase family protein [Pseudomonadota bacterium]
MCHRQTSGDLFRTCVCHLSYHHAGHRRRGGIRLQRVRRRAGATGGGAGGSPQGPGVSGVHCHMSNTRNTPAEALEYHYPLRIWRNAIRDGSGGAGRHRGGDGIVREAELLGAAQVT